jgi:4-oxalocrotonate tautomerase
MNMPVLQVQMLSGRSAETKKMLIKNLTQVVMNDLQVPADSVRVLIQEIDPDHWGVGGLPIEEYRRQNLK